MIDKITKKEEVKNEVTKIAKRFSGVVSSDKMKDTIVVDVARFVKHPKYGKFIKRNKKFKANDAGNTKKIGDKVTIEECRPISKGKNFKVVA